MAEMIAKHKLMGEIEAKLNWTRCGDPGGNSGQHKNLTDATNTLRKKIQITRTNLDLILTDLEMSAIDEECQKAEIDAIEAHEIYIEKDNRPANLGYNIKAIVIKTRKSIPEDIIIGLSYGWKFLFPYITNDTNLHEILSQLEMCVDESIPPLSQHEAYSEIAQILSNRKEITLDPTIQWLRFLALRAKRFFKTHEDVFATRSDKGGHTVIIDKAQYEEYIRKMLDNPSYSLVNDSPLHELTKKEEKLIYIFRKNHKTNGFVDSAYEPATKQLAKFYGLPKVHKENFCLRPITAMSQAPGHLLGRIFNKLLNVIFPRTHFHIKDSYEMVEFLNIAMIREEDVLVSFDVVSMYTNIPRELVKTIILNKQTEICNEFGIGKKILIETLQFLLVDSTFFTALDNIYKQNEGLPMGGCISTTLARMVMDEVAEHLLLNEPDISFIRIFVDDTIAAMKREKVENALEVLNKYNSNMAFTCEMESNRRSINFLNITLIREKNFIITNWYRKHFASGRLLPYFSSHKRSTILGTAEAFIKTVLRLSDSFFYTTNKPLVEKTLRSNGFPETTVQVLMNKFYTLTKPAVAKIDKKNVRYKIFPHSICESRRIKRVLHRLKYKDIVYADSTKNTKINFVKTSKTFIPLEKRGNIILKSTCLCKRKMKFTSTQFNENGEIASKRILTEFQHCSGNRHAFREIEYKKGLAYRKQTNYLLKYNEWKHRENILDNKGLPNYSFVKLMKRNKI